MRDVEVCNNKNVYMTKHLNLYMPANTVSDCIILKLTILVDLKSIIAMEYFNIFSVHEK